MKKVALLTTQFFDLTGTYTQMGGGERYLIDLVRLLRKKNYSVDVFQASTTSWVKSFKDVKITGIPCPIGDKESFPDLTIEFHKRTENYDYTIYFVATLAFPEARKNSIAISHGIWWDNEIQDWYHAKGYNEYIRDCYRRVGKIVSVDTNTIGWTKALYPKLYDKFEYIPNYVNTDTFKPREKKGKGKFTVLIPRRLHELRGYLLAAEASKKLLPKYKDMEFYFVGRGTIEGEQQFKRWVNTQDRVRWEHFDMNKMYRAYEQADIVLIPTLGAEGTSLSCIEAQAFGKPVIASCVGGLSDLIIDGYNGLLIKPTVDNLCNSIEYLYHNRDKAETFGKNAREVSMAFDSKRWEEKWSKVLDETFPQ
ncbi:UNVERIFIED_CONTAM: glycosyltransferase involved in cell wall biosynthesis [Paenibacillus sp. PvR008]